MNSVKGRHEPGNHHPSLSPVLNPGFGHGVKGGGVMGGAAALPEAMLDPGLSRSPMPGTHWAISVLILVFRPSVIYRGVSDYGE